MTSKKASAVPVTDHIGESNELLRECAEALRTLRLKAMVPAVSAEWTEINILILKLEFRISSYSKLSTINHPKEGGE